MNQLAQISNQFLTEYYNAIMLNRANLINFYTQDSFMTYGGQSFKGIKQIQQKIESFGFQKIVYQIDDKDVQFGPINGSFIVFVTGKLCMDDQSTFNFSQVFNILPNGKGGLYLHNDIFRLVI